MSEQQRLPAFAAVSGPLITREWDEDILVVSAAGIKCYTARFQAFEDGRWAYLVRDPTGVLVEDDLDWDGYDAPVATSYEEARELAECLAEWDWES